MDATTLLLSKAHAEFRKLRNGEVADNLRAQGVDYKTIWGVESYRLKEIAALLRAEVQDDSALQELAERLWSEEVRESKMLATRLYPCGLCDKETACRWAQEIRYTELADQACMNLFARLPFAEQLVAEWIEQTPLLQYMALQLVLRLELTSYAERAAQISQDATLPLWLRVSAARTASEYSE